MQFFLFVQVFNFCSNSLLFWFSGEEQIYLTRTVIFLLGNFKYMTSHVYNLCFVSSHYKLGARVEICIEPLQKEEHLG